MSGETWAPARAKIAIMLPKLSGGGISRTRTTLAKGLLDSGHVDVEFLLERDGGELRHLVPNDCTVVELGKLRFRYLVPALVRYFRTQSPDVLLTSKELHTFAAIIARFITGSRVRIFPTMHGDFSERMSGNRLAHERFWMPYAVRAFYSRANGVIAVSSGVRKGLLRATNLHENHVRRIYNPFDLRGIETSAGQQDKHEAPYSQKGDGVATLVAAGRLAPQKDYQTLLRAVAIARKEIPMKLIVLGEGKLRKDLEELTTELGLSDVVDWAGFIENPFPAIRSCDLFVLSSRWEGLPGVLVQAFALGKTVVSTDCPHGPAEILDGGRYGKLVPVGDPRAFAEAICAALRNPDDPSRLQERAREFDISTVTQQYVDLMGLKQLHNSHERFVGHN